MGGNGSVKAWRRAEPKGQPEPLADPGMPTPWRKRIAALEADSKNHFRLIAELYSLHDKEKPGDRLDALETWRKSLTAEQR